MLIPLWFTWKQNRVTEKGKLKDTKGKREVVQPRKARATNERAIPPQRPVPRRRRARDARPARTPGAPSRGRLSCTPRPFPSSPLHRHHHHLPRQRTRTTRASIQTLSALPLLPSRRCRSVRAPATAALLGSHCARSLADVVVAHGR
jgi:hypothetical protein